MKYNSYIYDDCSERCPAGKFYDDEAGLCRSCGHGFFQPSEGSFKCLLCGLGKTTRTSEAVSQEVLIDIVVVSDRFFRKSSWLDYLSKLSLPFYVNCFLKKMFFLVGIYVEGNIFIRYKPNHFL